VSAAYAVSKKQTASIIYIIEADFRGTTLFTAMQHLISVKTQRRVLYTEGQKLSPAAFSLWTMHKYYFLSQFILNLYILYY